MEPEGSLPRLQARASFPCPEFRPDYRDIYSLLQAVGFAFWDVGQYLKMWVMSTEKHHLQSPTRLDVRLTFVFHAAEYWRNICKSWGV